MMPKKNMKKMMMGGTESATKRLRASKRAGKKNGK